MAAGQCIPLALLYNFSSTTAAVGIRIYIAGCAARIASYLLVYIIHASLIFFAVGDIRRYVVVGIS